MIEQLLKHYTIKTEDDYLNALREILQKIALAGLHRGAFFEKAAFYGGTCLRFFYSLDRFSEDLDFSLLRKNSSFDLGAYFIYLQEEFKSYGLEVDISQKKKNLKSNIESAFLKTDTDMHIISFHDGQISKQTGTHATGLHKQLKIKLEVDTNPPLDFITEEKLILHPYSFYVKCFNIPCLFAGKLHALLFRQWKNRVKGRDWYDFEWYVRNHCIADLDHLTIRAIESGNTEKNKVITKEILSSMLINKIESVDFNVAKDDVARFTSNKSYNLWSEQYFKDVASMM